MTAALERLIGDAAQETGILPSVVRHLVTCDAIQNRLRNEPDLKRSPAGFGYIEVGQAKSHGGRAFDHASHSRFDNDLHEDEAELESRLADLYNDAIGISNWLFEKDQAHAMLAEVRGLASYIQNVYKH